MMIDWMECVGVIATALAVTGVYCNNNRWIACFPLFLVSNILFFGMHYQVGLTSIMVRDGIFLLLAIVGWIQWARSKPIARTRRTSSDQRERR